MPSTPKTNIKRIKPYPFKAELKDESGARACQVILLTGTGILLEAPSAAVLPGEKVEVSFQLPVLAEVIQFSGVIVKVYNQMAGATISEGATSVSMQRLEIHFRVIDSTSRNHITRFLDQIGQRSRS
jgi:hypothetical protein